MNDQDHNPEAEKKSFLSPSRILLWLVALVGVILIVLELPPKNASQKSYKAIEARLGTDDEEAEAAAGNINITPLTKESLDEVLAGSPAREVSSDGQSETFRWNSMMKTHGFVLSYNKDGWVMGIRPLSSP